MFFHWIPCSFYCRFLKLPVTKGTGHKCILEILCRILLMFLFFYYDLLLKLHKTSDFVSISIPKWKRIWISCGVHVCFPICLLSYKLTFFSSCEMWQENGGSGNARIIEFCGQIPFPVFLGECQNIGIKTLLYLFFPLSLLRHTNPFFLSMKYGYVILEMFWIVSWSQKEMRKAIYKSVYKMYVIT